MPGKPSALVDTRVIYCGDNLDQLRKVPEKCVDRLLPNGQMTRLSESGRDLGPDPNW